MSRAAPIGNGKSRFGEWDARLSCINRSIGHITIFVNRMIQHYSLHSTYMLHIGYRMILLLMIVDTLPVPGRRSSLSRFEFRRRCGSGYVTLRYWLEVGLVVSR